MAKKTLQVNISEPCHEDWNKMTTTQCGAFCKSCQKEVIDFTNKSEAQIVDILSQVKGKVCGRFTADKLNTPLSKYEPDTEWYSWKKWAVAAGVLFGTGYVSADVFDLNPKLPDTSQLDNNRRMLGEPAISVSSVADTAAVALTMYNGITPADTAIAINTKCVRLVNTSPIDTPEVLIGDTSYSVIDTATIEVVEPPIMGLIAPVIMGKVAPQKMEKPKKDK